MEIDCEATRCLSTSCSDAELTMDRNVSKSPTGNEEYDSLLEGIFKQMEGLRSYGIEHSCQQGDGLIEHSKLDLKAPVKMVTGSGFIRASPEAVLEMLRNVEQRPTWDDLCDFGNVVRRLGESSDVIYLSYQGKLGVCARDLCLLRAWRKEADGTCVLVSSSVDCDEVPRVAGKVRAELRDCGYICAPAPGGCTLTYVIKLDMKGYIPLFFTNLIQSQHTFVIAMLRRKLEEEHALDQAGSIDGSG